MSKNSELERVVYVNRWNCLDSTKVRKRRPNRIVTTRYTWYGFVPLLLFEQFQRVSNLYFLLGMIINLLVDSPTPVISNVAPLLVLISFTLATRAYEDIKRLRADKELNEQVTEILTPNGFSQVPFESVLPGDIVRVKSSAVFPADMVLLSSSRPESNDCSIATANLDGESSLKSVQGVLSPPREMEPDSHTEINWWSHFSDEQMHLETVSSPTADLHEFRARLMPNSMVVTESNLLLRGAALRNTEFVLAVVVFVGPDTKLSLNSKQKKPKITAVDTRLNAFILVFLILQLALSLLCSVVWNVYFYQESWFHAHWYIPHPEKIHPWKRVESFFSFYILFIRFVPISLIFSIYGQKAIAAAFFTLDLKMYDEATDQRARVNTIELIETLGQIEYLFTDKTGTLTENQMKFHSCAAIDGDIVRDSDGQLLRESGIVGDLEAPQNAGLSELFWCLSVCHSVKVTHQDGAPNYQFDPELVNADELCYQASSPDEEAFLVALRRQGIVFLGDKRRHHYILYDRPEQRVVETVVVMDTLHFDAERKCMSVIVRCLDDKTYWLVTKGAECSIFAKLADTTGVDTAMITLATLSEAGLRVLVVARRQMDMEEVDSVCEKLQQCHENGGHDNDGVSEASIYGDVERDLVIVGVTGIEDQLQPGVPETMDMLKEAGIKVWVITGDRVETAINVSLAAHHLSADVQLHRLLELDSEVVSLGRVMALHELLDEDDSRQQRRQLAESQSGHALVVDGTTLQYLVQPFVEKEFLRLCNRMCATLCCRVTPLQKAQTVILVKTNGCHGDLLAKHQHRPGPITAAIGDGGNDVSMILEADVGLAVFGREGRQAVRVSDYAIPKFRDLQRAIFVHGQNFYGRLTTLILYFFYKSIMYIVPLAVYVAFSAASVVSIYEPIVTALYNVTFTNIPIFVFGFLEKPYSDEERIANPRMYRYYRHNSALRPQRFVTFVVLGILESCIIFCLVYAVWANPNNSPADPGNFQTFGLALIYANWIITTVKVLLLSTNLTRMLGVTLLANFVFSLLVQIVFDVVSINSAADYFLVPQFLSQPLNYISVLLPVCVCVSIDVLIRLLTFHSLPDPSNTNPPQRRYSVLPASF